MINVINQLFKIYFKINKLNLCKPLVRALENAKIPPEHFHMAERVTYNYFLGMKHMFDSDYRRADELLSFSFRNCHPHSVKNKRLVLIFLIPVKMLLGELAGGPNPGRRARSSDFEHQQSNRLLFSRSYAIAEAAKTIRTDLLQRGGRLR